VAAAGLFRGWFVSDLCGIIIFKWLALVRNNRKFHIISFCSDQSDLIWFGNIHPFFCLICFILEILSDADR